MPSIRSCAASLLLFAGCPDDVQPNRATVGPNDPTVLRYLHPIVPFAWDWEGADRRRRQLLAVAATSRHVVVIYPAPGGGMNVAWGGLDEPWREEALTPIGLDDAIGADAATGPDDTVHVAFLRLRDAADPAPIVLDHLAWRAGEGVVETGTVTGSPVTDQHAEATRPYLSIGVRRDGTVDAVVGHTDQQRGTGRYWQWIDHFTRRPRASAWTAARARDERELPTVDDIELGRFARVTYDAHDRPLIVHWVRNLTTGYSYGPEVLVEGDDGLFSPSHGSLANLQAPGVIGDLSPYLEGYPDAWVDPEYGWIYVTPLGGREKDLSGGVTGIAMLSPGAWAGDFTIEPLTRRKDIIHDPGGTDYWVGGRVMTNECRGVETAYETLYEYTTGRTAKGTTSLGRTTLCGYARTAPVIAFNADERFAEAGREIYPRAIEIDTDDTRASLVRDTGRTAFAHGHRPFDVGVTPLKKLVVSIGRHEVSPVGRPPWPSDDLLRIVSSDPPDGAEDVSPDLRELRVRVTGMAGLRDRIEWQGFDLSNGQPALGGAVLPGASEDELVLVLDASLALAPGLRYRVWLAPRGLDDASPIPHPWQYVAGDAPVITFSTAGEPRVGAYAPDARTTPLEVGCDFCGPDAEPVDPTAPGTGVGPWLTIGLGDDDIDGERVAATDFELRAADGSPVPCAFQFPWRGAVRLQWPAALEPGAEYTIILPEHLRTVLGRRPHPEQRTLRFRTAL